VSPLAAAADAGNTAYPSRFGSGNYYAPPGSDYGYRYGGAPGYAPQRQAAPAAPPEAAETPATGSCEDAEAEIARLKQRISELEAANERLVSRQPAPAAGATADYPVKPVDGGQYDAPAAVTGQSYQSGNTGTYVPGRRDPSRYVPPPQDIGPRIYEFNN
jgi:hypothetical protein